MQVAESTPRLAQRLSEHHDHKNDKENNMCCCSNKSEKVQGEVKDPVCGMTVDPAKAKEKGQNKAMEVSPTRGKLTIEPAERMPTWAEHTVK